MALFEADIVAWQTRLTNEIQTKGRSRASS